MADFECIGELEPGDVVTFDHIGEVPAFEDLVAQHIDSQMADLDLESYRHASLNVYTWAGRVPIKNLIRPPKFNGSLTEISLIKMEDAYERRLSVQDRGLKFAKSNGGGGGGRKHMTIHGPAAEQQMAMYQGFELVADAQSSNGWTGQICTEVYYYPVPVVNKGRACVQKPHNYGGLTVNRNVTSPVVVEDDSFAERLDASKQRGFKVQAEAMRNSLSIPMRG